MDIAGVNTSDSAMVKVRQEDQAAVGKDPGMSSR
jgi:hypothetical protein